MARRKQPQVPSAGIAPVLLAAGASRRLGECKALVDLEGQTPLERLAEAARAFGQAPPLVLVGAHEEAIRKQLPTGCELLVNPDWEAGRTGSLKLAAAARTGWDLAILPVDVPRVPVQLCLELATAWQQQGSPPRGWLAPRHKGRFGHPVLLGRELGRRLATFGPDQPLSELRQAAEPLLSLETDFYEVLEDLDTPLDLALLRRITPQSSPPRRRESEGE